MSRQPEPRVHPTSPAMLVVLGLVAGVAGWVLFDRFYGAIPPLNLLPGITLLLLAAVEAITAWTTKRRIDRRPGTEPVNALAAARYVLVAKASSTAGAIFTGGYAGILLWVSQRRDQITAAASDVVPAALGLVGSALLLLAALWLERSCRIPDRPEDDTPGDR